MKQAFYTLLLCFFIINLNAQKDDYFLYIGTYTRGTSEGLYVYKFNSKSGDFAPLSIVKNIANPSFLTIHPDKNLLCACEGQKGDSVRAFSINRQNGTLTTLNAQPTGGVGCVHLQMDQTAKWLIVAHYRSASLNVFPLTTDGFLEKYTQNIQHTGKSVNPERQNEAHVHAVYIAPNNRDVFIPDLGMDKIVTYHLDAQNGRLTEGVPPYTQTNTGAGPRHFKIHPNGKFAYVIQELDATITAFSYNNNGKLTPFQTINTLPNDFKGLKWASDVHISPDGKFLYGSNRAHESLAIFKIGKKTGRLTLVGHQNVMGKTPRNFAIDPSGSFVLVANQESDNIVIFKRNKKTGLLTPTGKEIKISMPVCLLFLKQDK